MKFSCSRQELSEALNNVTRAVAAKTTHPAMEGVLIVAEDDRLTLSCYNMELGITTYMEAHIVENGSIVLNAKLFFDMVRRLASEKVEIECDEKLITKIRGGAAEYNIIGIEAEEFPQLPAVDEKINFTIKQETLKSMIDQTIFAVAVNDFKPVHTGSKFIIKDHVLSVVSVDGFRLAIRQEQVTYGDELDFIVPGKSLSEVAKLLEGDEEMLIALSQKHIIFRIGRYDVVSRLLEGDFIDFRSSIPASSNTVVEVKVRDFLNSIDRTSLLINDRLKSPIRLSIGNGEIKISCSTALGKISDVVECDIKGDPVEMGFNNRYLLEALRATGCDKVKMVINSPLAPVKIQPMEGESFLFLVLPVRMKADI
ncbi:MAG: DNA polymerase III subunit beta [Oscillospiraceae bacterium]|nr:DNA polymerase III subunit beta [Oscillospiraceae bacterium]